MFNAYEIAIDNFIKVNPDESIFQCGILMGNSDKKYVVIVEKDKILGIIIGINIIKKLIEGELSENIKAINCMTPLEKISKDISLDDLIKKMIKMKISQVQVENKIIDKETLLEYIYLK